MNFLFSGLPLWHFLWKRAFKIFFSWRRAFIFLPGEGRSNSFHGKGLSGLFFPREGPSKYFSPEKDLINFFLDSSTPLQIIRGRQEWFSPSVICLTNCTFLGLGTLPKWQQVILRVSKSKLVPRENDLCQAHNSKFLEVNHSILWSSPYDSFKSQDFD